VSVPPAVVGFRPVAALAAVGAATIYGSSPAVALGSELPWRVEVALALVVLTAPVALAV
jgi:hypothetical protein